MPRWSLPSCILACVFLSGACAQPPSKEMDQAQGAIDTARAAGAEQYAATQFAAAVEGLKQSHEAVAQRDYRLALSRAIDSRSAAQDAAKAAGEARANARGDAERAVAEANAVLTRARERLNHPDIARLPRRAVDEPRTAIEAAEKSMQEARAALERNDYPRAVALTDGLSRRVQAALAALEEPATAPPARRRR